MTTATQKERSDEIARPGRVDFDELHARRKRLITELEDIEEQRNAHLRKIAQVEELALKSCPFELYELIGSGGTIRRRATVVTEANIDAVAYSLRNNVGYNRVTRGRNPDSISIGHYSLIDGRIVDGSEITVAHLGQCVIHLPNKGVEVIEQRELASDFRKVR